MMLYLYGCSILRSSLSRKINSHLKEQSKTLSFSAEASKMLTSIFSSSCLPILC
uniref:Uncharacterized protein n=1 Tax=Octopus bimaculoides TaxID=37653 RepID=A0A0L8GHC7_OCTBM